VRVTTRRKDNLTALPLVAPFVVVYAALFVWPTLQMVATSFTNGGLVTSGNWVGLANYARLIDDHKFWGAVGHTLYFVLMTVVPSERSLRTSSHISRRSSTSTPAVGSSRKRM